VCFLLPSDTDSEVVVEELRVCRKCGIEKPIVSFEKRYDKTDPSARRVTCRVCRRGPERFRKRSAAYRDRQNERRQIRGAAARREVRDGLSCSVCGESDPATLDFHHRDPSQKTAELSKLLKHGLTARALSEMGKCDVLCANCHRKLHALERRVAV
jgi:hypothetical protein